MNTPVEKKETERMRKALYEATRKILLVGIGAVSLAQDEAKNFLDRLVERGEMAEEDARKLVREMADRRSKLEKERAERREKTAHSPAATRSDVEALNMRIAELTHQIEELRKAQSS